MRTEHHALADLDDDRRLALLDRLYPVQNEIFEGVERDGFARALFPPGATDGRLHLYAEDDRVVGYLSTYCVARTVFGRSSCVVRGAMGFLPAHQRRNLFAVDFLRDVVTFKARQRTRPVYVFACPVNPSMYRVLVRHVPTLWPHPTRALPPDIEAQMVVLSSSFGLAAVEGASPLIRDVGWRARHPLPARRGVEDEGVAFYRQLNSAHGMGRGLTTLMPATWDNIGRGALRLFRRRARWRWVNRPRVFRRQPR